MDLGKVLAQLHDELANLDAAIASLEFLQKQGRHHGRAPNIPPKARKRGGPPGRKSIPSATGTGGGADA
jgi:hypothetical protein